MNAINRRTGMHAFLVYGLVVYEFLTLLAIPLGPHPQFPWLDMPVMIAMSQFLNGAALGTNAVATSSSPHVVARPVPGHVHGEWHDDEVLLKHVNCMLCPGACIMDRKVGCQGSASLSVASVGMFVRPLTILDSFDDSCRSFVACS